LLAGHLHVHMQVEGTATLSLSVQQFLGHRPEPGPCARRAGPKPNAARPLGLSARRSPAPRASPSLASSASARRRS
jgi:hypothetical protein